MEEIKLSQEEIASLKELQSTQGQLISNFGTLEYQIQKLELQKDELLSQMQNLQNKENSISEELSKKYGNGSIDLDTGIFTKV